MYKICSFIQKLQTTKLQNPLTTLLHLYSINVVM